MANTCVAGARENGQQLHLLLHDIKGRFVACASSCLHIVCPQVKGVNSLHAADGWPAMKRAAAAAACLVLCFQAVVMPSEEEIKEAEAQVEAWADYVRQLKAQGRGNKVCVNGWCCGRCRRLVLAAALNVHMVQLHGACGVRTLHEWLEQPLL